MLHALTDLQTYALHATDGDLGSVKDLYFDDSDWSVRYLVANSGFWFFGRDVLLNADVIGAPDPDKEILPVRLTRDEIKDAPSASSHETVSQRHGHGGLPPFISRDTTRALPPYLPLLSMPRLGDDEPLSSFEADIAAAAERGDPHLRSGAAIRGYDITASDGHIGTVDDVIVGVEPWRVRYLAVDTAGWLGERVVVLSVDWIRGIDHLEKTIAMPLTRQAIKDSPTLNSLKDLGRPFERRLHDALGFAGYWS
ncbi:MAG: PRC-barrel domain-containing protein [Alphaproteobacteria bacterium]